MASDSGTGWIGRRAFLRGGAAVGMTAVLAACNSANRPGANAGTAGGTDEAIAWSEQNLPNLTPAVIEAAAKEGVLNLTLSNFGDPALKSFIAAFNKRFPFISVNLTSLTLVPLLQKFAAERSAKRGESDIFTVGGPSNATPLIKEDAFLNYVISDDAVYHEAAKQSGYWYALHRQFTVTVYRTGELKDAERDLVKTWQGLTDPMFKGRLGTIDVTNEAAAANCYAIQTQMNPTIWDGLTANGPVVKPALAAGLDSLLSGEFDFLVNASVSTTNTTAKDGAPIEFTSTGPSVNNYPPQVISALAPHPNAAKLWQDWSLSKEAQTMWPTLSGLPSARQDIDSKVWYESESWFSADPDPIDIDWAKFETSHDDVVEKFDDAFKK